MEESTYQAAKDYLNRLENNKWRLQLDEKKMQNLNDRTQTALSNLLLKRNVSGARHQGSNLLLQNLKKLNKKKTIIDIGQLDPLVQVYETKIESLERESTIGAQEQELLKGAVEALVSENQELISGMDALIQREIIVCENSRKCIEQIENQKEGIKGKVESLEREKGKEMMKVMDSLQVYKQEISEKEKELLDLERTMSEVKRDLREALRREKRLVEENEHIQMLNGDLRKEMREKTQKISEMEEECEELEELKQMTGENNPAKLKRAISKVINEENEPETTRNQERKMEEWKEKLKIIEEEAELMRIEKEGEVERRQLIEEEMRAVKEQNQKISKEKMEMYRELKDTEMQLKSLEGNSEGRAKAFEELTEKLKKVIEKKTEKISELQEELESEVRQIRGESEREIKDKQREKDEILRKKHEEMEKKESLERTLMVKEEVIGGLRKERDFYKDKAEQKIEGFPELTEMENKNKKLEIQCQEYMKLNTNIVKKNQQLKKDLQESLQCVDDLKNELNSKEKSDKFKVMLLTLRKMILNLKKLLNIKNREISFLTKKRKAQQIPK